MAQLVLDVSLNERHIGTLSQTRKGARFAFDEDLVAGSTGRPLLSTVLPVRARPYAESLTGAWFEGLLPEGERLESLCREIDCDPGDYLGILAEVGWECAGAVSITRQGADYPTASEPRKVASDELAFRYFGAAVYPEEGVQRISLGGYQEKLCVVAGGVEVENGRVLSADLFLPDAATVSTHIIKPQIRERYPHLIEAEAWAMQAIRESARCAQTALFDLDGETPALIVQRFDRVYAPAGAVRRVHQEDCCQALGMPPMRKYASTPKAKGDDPTYRKIADLLVRYAEAPIREQCELLRQMTVNLAMGNVDAHAKNYAFLYELEAMPSLSPMYDVAPMRDIEPKARYLSLRIDGKVLADEVCGGDLINEAQQWGVPEAMAKSVVAETLDTLVAGIERANDCFPEMGEQYAGSALGRIERLRRLNAPCGG